MGKRGTLSSPPSVLTLHLWLPRLLVPSPSAFHDMAHLQYFNYAGYGETAKENYHYSQAVRVGDSVHCSGQGGYTPHDPSCRRA